MYGISHWIDKHASITPERIALIDEHRKLNYKEMSEIVNHFASVLQTTYSVNKGDRVGLLSKNSMEYIIALFALAKLNAIVVPLNIRLSIDELEFQLKDSGLQTLIVDRYHCSKGKELLQQTHFPYLLTFDSLFQAETESLIHTEIDPTAPYIICYTSGTTGRPKGAVLTQENMFWNAVNNTLSLDITSKDKIITLLPLFHIGGIGLFTLPVLLAGGTVVVPDRFEPEQALKNIEKFAVTIVMGVPTIHDALRKSPYFETMNLSSVRFFYNGGAPCPEELIRWYLQKGIQFGQGYGLTETSPTVFLLSEDDFQCKVSSIGKPVMFTEILVVDDEGREVVRGEIGELLVKGPNVMKEYWNLPDETDKSIQNGWFSTGDMVRQDDDGFVYIAGRKKEMIISGGENIYPLEVEKVIYDLPEVEEVAVIGVSHDKWGETPIAFVSIKDEVVLTEDDLKQHCARKLARYKVPSVFKLVSALPKNATGKVDKVALKKYYVGEVMNL
ncbi:o-succinylbenzoate--CoA ligase [Psychrobacillus sp. OK032]|uniref:o-succinylbenzoate--CoA ligase n=1 Tax=Psychrobacillus sp. OK032 TaxID=1884358 RepID=UPI0008AD1DC1|nr:o-succinylbenzoate--CoA ligase [Psychrobacillus sp. OK032]SES25135.1 fatty-acyl-CoA synthase [Psychrobacillus sp. OK032]